MSKVIIFDFDGTLAQTLEAMIEVYNGLAKKFRCRPIDPKDINHLRGGNIPDLFRAYRITPLKLPFLVIAVRRGLKKRMGSLPLQPDVANVIRTLKARGITVGILSSNSRQNIEASLRAHGLFDEFAFVDSYGHLFGKHRALKKIAKKLRLSPEDIVYVGDEVRDVEAAKNAGVTSVAVTWGFQTRDPLERAQPDTLIEKPEELLSLGK